MLLPLLLAAPAAAGSLDLRVSFQDGPELTVSTAEVVPGVPLPVVVQPMANGDELVVTANVLGVVEGEAVVQVDAVWRRACCESRRLSVVFEGSESVEQVLADHGARVTPVDWLDLALVQDGVLDDTEPGAWHWSLVLPREVPAVTWGHVAGAVAPATSGAGRPVSSCTALTGASPHLLVASEFSPDVTSEAPTALRGLLLLTESRPFGKHRRAETAQCRVELPDGDDIELDLTVRWL